MAWLTIVLPDDVSRESRIRAVEVYDGQKGALGKAITDAVRFWLKQPVAKKSRQDLPSVLSRWRPKSHRSRLPRGTFVLFPSFLLARTLY